MESLKDLFEVLFMLSLLVARVIFWTALGALPIIYFFLEVDSIVSEIVITSIIVSFCYYKCFIWFKTKREI